MELRCAPSVDAEDIGVTVDNGVVTLSGRVRLFPEKWEAVRAARRVAGVRAVADDIEVMPPIDVTHTDSDIALAAADALEWSTLVPDDRVKATVKAGWVTLEGQVEWHYEKSVAENTVRKLAGVKGVTNNIVVKPA